MTDPKLSHPGAVGLTRYDILRNDYDDYEIVPDEQPNVPGRFYLASEVDAALSAKDAELAKANKKLRNRCEHCGSDRIYSGPPECSGCGAPICCETCCKWQNETSALQRQLAEAKEQIAACEGDARRYKYLRDDDNVSAGFNRFGDLLAGAELDSAIDAHLSADKGEG